jgi:Cys-tRNA(Pro) deacylase
MAEGGDADDGSVTPATMAVAAAGITHRVVTHGPVRSAAEAAAARGVVEAALVKTLVVRLAPDDHRLVAVGADRSISWPKLRALLGVSRLSMAETDRLIAITGYSRGTVTPFGADPMWPLIVDAALLDHAEVSVGGGAHGVALQLAPSALVAHFGAVVADVTVPPAVGLG